jgi:hypothetical protein
MRMKGKNELSGWRRLLHRIHEWATRNPVCRINDPILGELVINESSWWECMVLSKDGTIVLNVGGRYEPDEKLIETARETFMNIDMFIDKVTAYLKIESEQKLWGMHAQEINTLKIRDINYWWPRKPNAGMVFFNGPDEYKLWHCDIDGPRLYGLAFDS